MTLKTAKCPTLHFNLTMEETKILFPCHRLKKPGLVKLGKEQSAPPKIEVQKSDGSVRQFDPFYVGFLTSKSDPTSMLRVLRALDTATPKICKTIETCLASILDNQRPELKGKDILEVHKVLLATRILQAHQKRYDLVMARRHSQKIHL